MIGSLVDYGKHYIGIGKEHGGISSDGDGSCPYNVPNDEWRYFTFENLDWKLTGFGSNDVSVECLKGIIGLFIFLFVPHPKVIHIAQVCTKSISLMYWHMKWGFV